jgi:hypothetical protein
MPALQTVFTKLNEKFQPNNIAKLAVDAERFAPGEPLSIDWLVPDDKTLQTVWKAYMRTIPLVFHEAVRGAIYHALNGKHTLKAKGDRAPTQITFAWAPAYDNEITIWQAPDTAETKGGITVVVKGRYPADPHPLRKAGSGNTRPKKRKR